MVFIVGDNVEKDVEKSKSADNESKHHSGSSIREISACITACLACCSSGIILGYTTVGLDSMEKDDHLKITEEESSWIAGMGSLGGAVGSVTCGYVMNRIGRKSSLIYYCSLTSLIGWMFVIASKPLSYSFGQYEAVLMIIVGRFFGGLTMGSSMSVAAVYIVEAASPELVERLGPLTMLARSSCQLLAMTLGTFIDWFSFAVVAACLLLPFMAAIFMLPESPIWLVITKQDTNSARKSLLALRGKHYNPNPDLQLLEKLSDTTAAQSISTNGSRSTYWKSIGKMVAVSTGIMIFAQFTGNNPFILYTVQIIHEVDPDINAPAWSIGISVTLVTMPLVTVMLTKWFSSKSILLWTTVVFTLALYGFATHFYLVGIKFGYKTTWLALSSVTVYYIAYGIGFGSLLYSIATAILPPEGRAIGISIGVTLNWFFSFVLVKCYFLMKNLMGMSGLFYFYAICSTVSIAFIQICIPKTLVNTRRLSVVSN